MQKRQKHILKAAKDNIENKFCNQIASINDEIGLLSESNSQDTENKIKILKSQRSEIEEEMSEWSLRSRKNKGKLGNRVEWTGERDETPKKTIKHEVLWDVRAKRKEKNKAKVGISWLKEGALVTKRGNDKIMIVTSIHHSNVEVLHDGIVELHRDVSLRPADWMLED
jgi:hypothetical protein